MECGVYFFASPPTEKELRDYYKTTYSKVHQKQLFDLIKQNYDSGYYGSEVENIELYLGLDNKKEKKILDYGCGYGFFLKSAKDAGFAPFGLEYDEEVAEYNKTELGIQMISSDKLEQIQSGTFDVIRAYHCIEHLPNPRKTLSIFYDMLKENGIFTMSSPCFSSDIVQSNALKLYDLVYPEHLIYFTKKSIDKLLSELGFDVEMNITQFTNSENALHLLGVTGTQSLTKSQTFEEFTKIMESDPFAAGINLNVVARKKKSRSNSFVFEKRNNEENALYVCTLRQCMKINDNTNNWNLDAIDQNGPSGRGTYFNFNADTSKWSLIFPFENQNFMKGSICVSGTLLTLDSNLTVAVLDGNKNPLPNSTIVQNNKLHNFIIINEYSGESTKQLFYVCISGTGKSEFFLYDLISTERQKC